jgi:hypothetical protein
LYGKLQFLKGKVCVGYILRNKRNMKSLPNEELRTLIVQWFQEMFENIPINGPLLPGKAT